MINFMCASIACLSQYLGFGIVMYQDSSQVIYQHYSQTYYCQKQSYVYSCTVDVAKVRYQ